MDGAAVIAKLPFLPECDRGGTLQIEVPHSYTGQCPPQPEV
ncbi:hypothetical protein QPK87_24995 [Kamptonema cortianum]|nr:hypothetical protein [Kamptonema cortianum]